MKLSDMFKWPTCIATILSIIMAVAIAILGFRTRNDPFPEKPAAVQK